MSVAISTLMPQIRMKLAGCPEPVIEDALYRIVREFFWKSEAWKYTYDNGLDWTASQLAMPTPTPGTDIPTKCIVKRVDNVKYDAGGDSWDTDIPFKTRDELDRENPDWRTETSSTPSAWTYDNAVAVITPIATDTVTTGLLIRSVIAPNFTATSDTLPDLYFYEFEKYLRAGVLAELFSEPGEEWTDLKQSAYYLAIYEDGINRAKSRSDADFGQPKGVMAYGGL